MCIDLLAFYKEQQKLYKFDFLKQEKNFHANKMVPWLTESVCEQIWCFDF